LLALLLLPFVPGCAMLRWPHGTDWWTSPLLVAPPAEWKAPRTLRAVTFNIKDIYWLSDHRAERMAAIADELVAARPDVVCLQEAFIAGDVAVIASAMASIGVEHAIDYPSGVVGSGLWTFSRWPIRETFFLRYVQNGAPLDTEGGDWWVGKGVGLARLELAPGEFLDVFNTHMICPLGPQELQAHRISQAREYAGFVAAATPPNVPALMLGDFNCGFGGRVFAHLNHVLQWQPLLARRYFYDHVFGRSPGDTYTFTPLAEVPISRRLPDPDDAAATIGLSDHTGLMAVVQIAPPRAPIGPPPPPPAPYDPATLRIMFGPKPRATR
jgi:hypothetical protein